MKYTEKDFLGGKCTHEQYYAQFVTTSVEYHVGTKIGVERIIKSNSFGGNFNDIPLKEWTDLGYGLRKHVAPLLKEAGHYTTAATMVCILKAAARKIRKEYRNGTQVSS